ncbi:hypothetical protein HBH98_241480 [Parastagonospora nodorum]|nr:hypothetical protein HBH53_246310 [Parastagonospora nodorum]KAH3956590.1 hypothetical protein HBH51_238610 [Parastagonospora nodorum]KAH4215591.1 hypothetical protein HBI06_246240 [Parastagonospora nodorum]KAH4224356.1 hypothetical protein HBI05_239290 [Parastagonospora nodorum]KAH4334385.1 hypothetical protein HBH98_241480 [Parastagonospora nodorum]
MALGALDVDALPKLEVLHLDDSWWNRGTDYARLPSMLKDRCPHLRDLMLDFWYQTAHDDDTITLWPPANCLSSLGSLEKLSVHRDLLFARSSEAGHFINLATLLPTRLETLQVTGIQPAELNNLLETPKASVWLAHSSSLPATL